MVVVNTGGVSNITYIDGADTLIACDTGPGNALLDDFMFRMTPAFDCEGRMAAQVRADEAWVARALEHPFFALRLPNRLTVNDFASLTLHEKSPADVPRPADRPPQGGPQPSPGSFRCCRRCRGAGSWPAGAPQSHM